MVSAGFSVFSMPYLAADHTSRVSPIQIPALRQGGWMELRVFPSAGPYETAEENSANGKHPGVLPTCADSKIEY